MTLASLFDGISGFPLAAVLNGIEPVWASEIEDFPIAVAQHRFPGMQHFGDICKLDGAKLPPVDIITGGSPCQDLSVAGNRAGLAGERSGLFMEQIRITKEMRCADELRGRTAHLVRPRYFVWENVPGAFSSAGGEDFLSVLEETCRIADSTISIPGPPGGRWEYAGAILGEKFSLAWRVCDAQYWGVPQRRKRIFLVADFGGLTAPQILFEQDRLLRHTAQGEGAWEGFASTTENGVGDTSRPAFLTADDVFAFHINQREETIDLQGISGALMATTNMQMQTFISTKPGIATAAEPKTAGGNNVISTLYAGYGTRWNGNAGTYSGDHFISQPQHTAFACNQRDEVRELGSKSGALGAQPGMKQQTFISKSLTPWDTQQARIFTADGIAPTLAGADGGGGRNPAGVVFASGIVSKGNGDCFITENTHTSLTSGGGQAGQGYPCILTSGFNAGASPCAGSIGYQDECSPTLKAGSSGTSMVPSILCMNDQGGQRMDFQNNVSGTLRAEAGGHLPIIMFDNHQQAGRVNGPIQTAPTVAAAYGMGGGNGPLLMDNEDSFCIMGNAIDRLPHNGGNGIGYQENICYTLNTTDRHAVMTQTYQDTVGTLCRGDEKGVGSQYVSQDKCIVSQNLIRRLTPLECERLQGFPDGWTNIPGASDTARYKALGNSVAIPCVAFILRGIAYFLKQQCA